MFVGPLTKERTEADQAAREAGQQSAGASPVRLYSPGRLLHLQRYKEGAEERVRLVDGHRGQRFELICVRASRYEDHKLGAIEEALKKLRSSLPGGTQ